MNMKQVSNVEIHLPLQLQQQPTGKLLLDDDKTSKLLLDDVQNSYWSPESQ